MRRGDHFHALEEVAQGSRETQPGFQPCLQVSLAWLHSKDWSSTTGKSAETPGVIYNAIRGWHHNTTVGTHFLQNVPILGATRSVGNEQGISLAISQPRRTDALQTRRKK